MNTLRERLKYAREQLRGLTQQELADLSGVNRSSIGNIEGASRPQRKVYNLMELATALRVSPDWLSRGTGPIEFPTNAAVNQAGISAVSATDILTLTAEEFSLIEAYRTGGDGVQSLLRAAVAVAHNHAVPQRRRA